MNIVNDNDENAASEIDIDKMRRYIAYCKSSVAQCYICAHGNLTFGIENVPLVLPPKLRPHSARIS